MASFLIVFLAIFAPDPFREVVEDIAERPAMRSPGAVELGISLGCPLSPPMGAFFLQELDERSARGGLFNVRFMDDVLFLAPARWKLRQGGQGGQRGAGVAAAGKASRQDLHRQDVLRQKFTAN